MNRLFLFNSAHGEYEDRESSSCSSSFASLSSVQSQPIRQDVQSAASSESLLHNKALSHCERERDGGCGRPNRKKRA